MRTQLDDIDILLTRTATGDHAAFADLYDLTSSRVYGMVLRVLRDPGHSEEVTQEVYLAVWRSSASFHAEQGSAISWLMTLAHRRAVDRVRSEAASKRRTLTYGTTEHADRADRDVVIELSERRELARTIRSALGLLTPLQREAIELAYFQGLTYREVADHLDVALPTVKSRIRQGLKRLAPQVTHLAA
ncbi:MULTISPECIES: ECF RNA polymerase sigma factor SigK [unclassified Gordonia (in: high G+C Gram-positive bacteria)]